MGSESMAHEAELGRIGWEFLPGENLNMLKILSEDLGAL